MMKARGLAGAVCLKFAASAVRTFHGCEPPDVTAQLAWHAWHSGRRFLRLQRSISLLVSDGARTGRCRVVHGQYQTPILVQWRPAEGFTRELDICLTQFQ